MDIQNIYEMIPEINLIQDETLRQKCADAWKESIELGGWDKKNGGFKNCPLNVEDLPDGCPDNDGLKHIRTVASTAAVIYDAIGEWANTLGVCDRDTTIAAAVLHDLGKPYEYDLDENGNAVYTQKGKFFRHTMVGAYLANKHGLPPKVVHAILNHSPNVSPRNGKGPQFAEGVIVTNTDHIVWGMVEITYSKNLKVKL